MVSIGDQIWKDSIKNYNKVIPGILVRTYVLISSTTSIVEAKIALAW
jgi:hypothetical protein